MSAVTSPVLIDRELAAIVGDAHIRRTAFEINGVIPSVVVSPASPEEVGAVLRFANERGLVVAPAGGLTKQQIGGVPERIDILLSITRMNQIEQYDPGDLTICGRRGHAVCRDAAHAGRAPSVGARAMPRSWIARP